MIIGKTIKNNSIFSSAPKFVDFTIASATRHGLITGSTGTGKTVTTRVLAEQFSNAGVPCLVVDVKGDMLNMSESGHGNAETAKKAKEMGIGGWKFAKYPTKVWGKDHRPKLTVSKLGSNLLANMLGLTEAQASVLSICFDLAECLENEIVDLKQLLEYLNHLLSIGYKNNPKFGFAQASTVGVIQRKVFEAMRQGADGLFSVDSHTKLGDLMVEKSGKGLVNILDARVLIKHPNIYGTLILWLLEKFYEELPEAGQVDKPKFMFFIDEAHLLFEGTRKSILQKIENIVRLIRSKGVGVFFVTQSPSDIPSSILGQLGNKVQHTLRAFTATELKTVKSLAECFVQNPEHNDLKQTITTMATGHALVSFLSADGVPSQVELVEIVPPRSKFLS